MGIPRFYRWLSERYPLINELIAAEQIPEFDNLYLDMNGIIHNCSHNNTGGLCVADETDVFVEAFKYICRLVHIIKPKKLLYMAIDGCAPRAKMNQQRSRRFRAANDAREGREKAEEMGEIISGTPFDSNCITPGTEFMAKLTQHLRFFVQKKIQEDPMWQGITVIVSGPDVPGEGEHKVMDYIRTAKAQPGYNPNLRHCLYGLDADLIMLALASHEPHFALLREEVVFGRQQTESVEQRMFISKDRFQLMHISLLREYLDLEFRPGKEERAGFVYDLETMIDDFILFCVLVGNDFLPHLPFSEIGDGGLENFMGSFKQHLKQATPGKLPWLTKNCGDIDWENLWSFLSLYASIEDDKLQSAVDDQAFVLGRKRSVGPKINGEEPGSTELYLDIPYTPEDARVQYYEVKFEIDVNNYEGTQKQRQLFQSYLEGLQWVMHYYYRGPDKASWSWYYPYYHAPMIYDLVNYDMLANPGIQFEVGAPFSPFQQLMAVLPSNSKNFLPPCYQKLFDSPSSPILDFYPSHFDIDVDGVTVPWGGVTLIPWIDPSRLLDAMEKAEGQGPALTKAEQERNKWGTAMAFQFSLDATANVESTIPQRFGNITNCPVRSKDFKHPIIPPAMVTSFNRILPGCRPNATGFPTLQRHLLTTSFEGGVKVFQFESRGQSLIIHMHPSGPVVPDNNVITQLLQARCVQIDYPCVHKGKAVAVHTPQLTYLPNGQTSARSRKDHEDAVRQMTWEWRQKGLTLNFDPAVLAAAGSSHPGPQALADSKWLQQPIVEVRAVEASYIDAEGRTQYRFKSGPAQARLLHLVRVDEPPPRISPPSLSQRFPHGERVLCIAKDHDCFGETGMVRRTSSTPAEDVEAVFSGTIPRKEKEQLQLKIQAVINQQQETLQWHGLEALAQAANLHINVARYIVGTLFSRSAEHVREDIGMNFICESKQDGTALCLPAYSARVDGVWYFSDLAVEALQDYVQLYPEVFLALRGRKPRDKDLECSWIFWEKPDPGYTFSKLVKYIKGCAFKKLRLVPERHMAVSPSSIAAIVAAVDDMQLKSRNRQLPEEKVRGYKRLYKAEDLGSRPPAELLPSAGNSLFLGQRVVYFKPQGLVPCGAKGTIVGIYGSDATQELELLLDEDNFGATDLHGRAPAGRGFKGPSAGFMPLHPWLDATAAAGMQHEDTSPAWEEKGASISYYGGTQNDEAKATILGMLKAGPAEGQQGSAATSSRSRNKLKGGPTSAAPAASNSGFPNADALPFPSFGDYSHLPQPPPPPLPPPEESHPAQSKPGSTTKASSSKSSKKINSSKGPNGSSASCRAPPSAFDPEIDWGSMFDELLQLGKHRGQR